jgi:hypothetical protein
MKPTADIILFRRKRTRIDMDPTSRPDASTSDDRIRESERFAIVVVVERNPVLRATDVVARRLTQMLDEAKDKYRANRTVVVRRAWPSFTTPQLKRLYKITLGTEGSHSSEHLRHLDKRVKNYAIVARAIADLCGWNAEDTLIDLFRGTSIEEEMKAERLRAPVREEPTEDYQRLANLIHAMGAWIAQEVDFQAHLERIAKIRGRYDLAVDAISSAGGTLLPHGPLAHNFEISDEFPPIPSVVLFEELLLPSFKSSLRFGVQKKGGIKAAIKNLLVEVRIWREVRLAIGPVDQISRPGPLFEVRTRVDISADHRRVLLRRPWLYLSGPEHAEVVLDGKLCTAEVDFSSEMTIDGSSNATVSSVPLEGLGLGDGSRPLQPEHAYVVWYPVTPIVCQNLLSRHLPADRSIFRLLVRENQVETLLPSGTVGAAIEAALLTEDEHRIDFELVKEGRRLAEMVMHYSIENHSKANDLHTQGLARWKLK